MPEPGPESKLGVGCKWIRGDRGEEEQGRWGAGEQAEVVGDRGSGGTGRQAGGLTGVREYRY